jgi:hypothetical protein
MNDFHVHMDKIYKTKSLRMWIPKILFNTDLLPYEYKVRYLISNKSKSNYLNLIIGTVCIYRGCDDPIAFNEIFRALQQFDSIKPVAK